MLNLIGWRTTYSHGRVIWSFIFRNAATKQVLYDFFPIKKTAQLEAHNLRNYEQNASQSLDEYVTELRKLSKDCKFADVDKEILSQIIQNCRSNRLH